MYSRLLIVPLKVPGTFKPSANATSARKAMERLPSRSMLGAKVPSPSNLTASGAAVFDDLIARFLDSQVHRAFDEAGCPRNGVEELWLLYTITLLNSGTTCVGGLDFRYPIEIPFYKG